MLQVRSTNLTCQSLVIFPTSYKLVEVVVVIHEVDCENYENAFNTESIFYGVVECLR